jgi:predicted dehydrogenase
MSQSTRRDFMRTTLASAAAFGLGGRTATASLPASVWKSSIGANDRIRLGAIGTGGMGQGDLKTFLAYEDVDCIAVCDIDSERVSETAKMVEELRGKRPDEVKDFRKIIERKDIDAVLVATPDHWHALPTIYACETGKDVYCEKPLATSIAEGRAMLNMARKHNRIVQMGTQWRSGEHFKEAAKFVQSGKLGKIRFVRLWAYLAWIKSPGRSPDGPSPEGVDYDMWLGPCPKRMFNEARFHFSFRWFWDYAGGLMTDWGVHLLNLALWSMKAPPPVRVSSVGGKYVWDDDTETPDTQNTVYEFPTFNLEWEHQATANSACEGKEHGIKFYGTEGTLFLWSNGWEVTPKEGGSLEAISQPAGPDARPAHVRNFLDCMRSREHPVEDVEIGHFVSTVAHLGNLAMLSGNSVEWDSKSERIKGNPLADRMIGKSYRAPWKLPKIATPESAKPGRDVWGIVKEQD